MKKPGYAPFLLLAAVFLCFCAGMFLGRNALPASQVLLPVSAQQSTSQDLLDLNQADAAQLMDLPGIGQTLAQRIVDYRQTYGPITSMAELLNIDGLGEAKLEALLPYITAGG